MIPIEQHVVGHRLPEFLSVRNLKTRGWTEKLIREFAPHADQLAGNPHHPGGAPMRLYLAARVVDIEATEKFLAARAAADRRRQSAKKGVATKAQSAAAAALNNILPPVLPAAPREELVGMAIRWFNGSETWRRGEGKWLSPAAPDVVLCAAVRDFIKSRLLDYAARAVPIGIALEQAAAAVDQKIMEAIAAQFPWLMTESQNRKEANQCGYASATTVTARTK